MRDREVICMSGNKTLDVSKCGEESVLFKSEDCNQLSCGPGV